MRQIIVVSAFAMMGIVAFAAFWKLVEAPTWDQAITSISMCAAFLILFNDWWISEVHRRRDLLSALTSEIQQNLVVATSLVQPLTPDVAARPYKRFYTQTMSVVLASAVFTGKRDSKLLLLLQEYLVLMTQLNQALGMYELMGLLSLGITSEEILKERAAFIDKAISKDGGIVSHAEECSYLLLGLIRKIYGIECPIPQPNGQWRYKELLALGRERVANGKVKPASA